MEATRRIQVVYFQRKRRPNANFSLEFIFADVRSRLNDQIDARVHLAPVFSNGLFRRLWICFDAMWHQGQINHVTGDTNFVAIGLTSKRTVVTILDCGFLHRPEGVRRSILKKFWLDLPVKNAAVVTTISESARREIIQFSGCDPSRVVVVPVAVSDAFQPNEKPFDAACPRILQLGTAPNKNLSRSIEALQGIPCRLVVVGKLGRELVESLNRLNIQFENYVEISANDLLRQYQQADIVLFPSTYEGFGMPIIEGQRVGRPVITSNVSSMPEVAGAGACLVDPLSVDSIRSGLLRVIGDETYRNGLLHEGFLNSRRFDGQKVAEQYLKIYRDLICSPN